MKVLLLAGLLASTCFTAPKPTPDPVPYPIPDGGDDASAPITDPETQCAVAWAVMADAECAPATGFATWMKKCANYPQATVDCVMTAESCATMRNCQGFE